MKNQYFQPRTLPKPIATFPELPGSARELPGAAEMLSGRLSSAPAPARAESGRPQNWSPVISGSPNPLKINENQYFQPGTLPKLRATFPELSGSATEPSGAAQKLCGGLPAARLPRARSPADLKTGPRRFPASKTQ